MAFGKPSNKYAALLYNPRYRNAQSLIQQGSSTAPVGHWTQALARVVQGGLGGWQASKAEAEENERAEKRRRLLARAVADPANAGKILAEDDDTAEQGFGFQIEESRYQRNKADRREETAEERAWRTAQDDKQFARSQALQAQGLSRAEAERLAAEERAKRGKLFEMGYEYGPDGKIRPIVGHPALNSEGAFGGQSIDAQTLNTLTIQRARDLVASGMDPKTAMERAKLEAATMYQTRPTVQPVPVDPNDPTKGMALGHVPRPLAPGFGPQAAPPPAPAGAAPPVDGTNPPPPAQPPVQPQGGVQIVPGTQKPVTFTDTQNQAHIYGTRVAEAARVLDELAKTGAIPNWLGRQALDLPLGIGNALASPGAQQYDQAARNLINAILRRESGAVISPSEFDNARKQYLPQPGDSPEVLAQKKRNIETVLQGFTEASGRKQPPAAPPPAPMQQPNAAPVDPGDPLGLFTR